MKMIYKYTLQLGEINKFKIPRERSLAKVGRDPASGNPAIWFIVDNSTPLTEAKYMVFATGQEIVGSASHVGTAICGAYVWHVFRIE